jgi:hypothetical protein
MVFLVLKQLLDGSASLPCRIPPLKERLHRSFTTDSSGIDGIAFGLYDKSEFTVGKRSPDNWRKG